MRGWALALRTRSASATKPRRVLTLRLEYFGSGQRFFTASRTDLLKVCLAALGEILISFIRPSSWAFRVGPLYSWWSSLAAPAVKPCITRAFIKSLTVDVEELQSGTKVGVVVLLKDMLEVDVEDGLQQVVVDEP